MSLASLQRDFLAHLAQGDGAIETAVGARGESGLAFYRHAFRANLTACLRDTFEKTRAWLGDEAFDAAALVHMSEHPPASWTLSDFGLGFDLTLADRYPADPEVAELAWLDWSLRRAFDGPDAEVQDPATFGDIDWERAVFRVAPTLNIRLVTTNAATLWKRMAEGEPPPPVARLSSALALVVWRRELSPMFRTLGERERAALEMARRGATFGEICATLAANHPEPDAVIVEAGGWLAGWLSDQIVAGVSMAA